MENTITTTAAQGAAKRNNPIKHFISALNAKRRKAVLPHHNGDDGDGVLCIRFRRGRRGRCRRRGGFQQRYRFLRDVDRTYRSGSRLCRRHYVRPRDQERRRGSKDPRTYDAGVGLCGVRAHAFA